MTPPATSDARRFALRGNGILEESDAGYLVEWSDHTRVVEELRRERDDARAEAAEWLAACGAAEASRQAFQSRCSSLLEAGREHREAWSTAIIQWPQNERLWEHLECENGSTEAAS